MTEKQELEKDKARWEKGQELYKAGAVRIGENGYFQVNGYNCDPDHISCDCPDFQFRKKPCKHIYASQAYRKARFNANTNGSTHKANGNGNGSTPKSEGSSKDIPNKPKEGYSKDFDKQATITRLAVLNTAVELLKTHRKPIELTDIISLASQLEQWALGNSH